MNATAALNAIPVSNPPHPPSLTRVRAGRVRSLVAEAAAGDSRREASRDDDSSADTSGRRAFLALSTASAAALLSSPIPAHAVSTSRRANQGARIPEEEYTTLPSGLKIYDIKVGSGPLAKLGDRVTVHYVVQWKGITFMTSRQGMGVTGGTPYGFDLGSSSLGMVLKGLDQGVEGMRAGGVRQMIVPPELAYGNRGIQEIPPNATLQMNVELLAVKQNAYGTPVKLIEEQARHEAPAAENGLERLEPGTNGLTGRAGNVLGSSASDSDLTRSKEQAEQFQTKPRPLPGSDKISRASESPGAVTGSMLLPAIPASFPLCDAVSDDYIPCLDNTRAIKKLRTTKQYQHRERHCPNPQEMPRCVVPMPEGYKPHVPWPESRDEIWFNNVPRTSLANYKADQNWLKVESDRFIFPGGGTQFKYGAAKYIAWLEQVLPELAWGRRVQVALDMGCGVASFGAYLDAMSVKVLSVAPKDEHEAQVQFALERGVPALVGVMGTLRQPFPANSFDAVHCARCRVPWHANGGMLLLELNRLIRPGGYFIWSATPVCLECKAFEPDDREVWAAMEELTTRMCWTLRAKRVNMTFGIGVAVWQKPTDNRCYRHRPNNSSLAPLCSIADEPDAACIPHSPCFPAHQPCRLSRLPAPLPRPLRCPLRYVPMQSCMHRVPMDRDAQHGSQWPADGAERLTAEPVWLDGAAEALETRAVVEAEEVWGAALAATGKPLWTLNVVPTSRPDTLPVVFERGLLGVYHDWCESFSTYPRTYDLLHAHHLLSHLDKNHRRGCDIVDVMLEMDRVLRPMGYVIIRETNATAAMVESVAAALHWKPLDSYKRNTDDTVLAFQKTMWRPVIEAREE
ncbi:unnamed protein product [Closterium sp. Naga37s-1]|nr:unnamed protein product [Closterium sp. Naga37s-1]